MASKVEKKRGNQSSGKLSNEEITSNMYENQIKNRSPAEFKISFVKYYCKFWDRKEESILLKREAERKLNKSLDIFKLAKEVSKIKVLKRLLL